MTFKELVNSEQFYNVNYELCKKLNIDDNFNAYIIELSTLIFVTNDRKVYPAVPIACLDIGESLVWNKKRYKYLGPNFMISHVNAIDDSGETIYIGPSEFVGKI